MLLTLLRKSTREANKKTLQVLCEKIAPTEKTFGPHVDDEEESTQGERVGGIENDWVGSVFEAGFEDFCGKCHFLTKC